MPHAALLTQDEGGITLPTPSGGMIYLPKRRVRIWVRLGSEFMLRHAILDTGAPACILPNRIWTSLHGDGEITWEAGPPGIAPVANLPRMPIFGERHPFRLGRVRLELADLGDGRLASREVLAICTEDIPPPPNTNRERLPLIIGLSEVLDGRSLLLQVSEDGQRWLAMMHQT